MADSEDDITSCPVCFEDYQETGVHVPRILPCYHTVCEKCLGELLCDDAIACPECRVSHVSSKGVKVFPQNRYILTHIRKRQAASVFNTDQLTSKLDQTAKDLNFHREHILSAKEELQKQNATVVSKITVRRDLVMRVVARRFEKLLQETSDQIEEVNKSITEEVATVDENMVLLNSIRETTSDASTEEDILNRLETVKGIAKQAKLNLAKDRKFRTFDYVESEAKVEDVKKLSGLLTEKESIVTMREGDTVVKDAKAEVKIEETKGESSDAQPSDGRRNSDTPTSSSSPVLPAKKKTALFSCHVNQSIRTEYIQILCVSQVGDSRVAVCGEVNGQYKMTMYDLHQEDMCSVVLKDEPGGISKIRLAGKQCIVVSYPKKRLINFHDANNLNQLVHSFPAQSQPTSMCPASPSMLLYQDKLRHVVCWLDCRSYIPTPMAGNKTTVLEHNWVRSMCYTESGGKPLLVISHFSTTFDKKIRSGLRAYNTETGEVEWSITGKVPGMLTDMSSWGLTTDRRGHLYVSDINNMCIQVFSTDGVYIGPILKQGDYGLGELWSICWCGNISSLVISCLKLYQNEQNNEIVIVNVSKVDPAVKSSGPKISAVRGRGRGRAVPRKTEAY